MLKKEEQKEKLEVPDRKELITLTVMTIFVVISFIACLVLFFLKLPEMIEYVNELMNERTQ